MRRSSPNHIQSILPFPAGKITIPGRESVKLTKALTIPERPDSTKIAAKIEMSDPGVGACGTCKLLELCTDLEFHKERPARGSPGVIDSCPLSHVLGYDLLSLPEWRQELAVRLRLIREKRDRQAASQMQIRSTE